MSANSPIIQSLAYNGSQIQLSWSPSGDSGVDGYVVYVLYDSQTVAFSQQYPMPWTPSTVPIQQTLDLNCGALDANVSYFVQVGTMWGNVPQSSELSQLVPLITLLPEISSVYYD